MPTALFINGVFDDTLAEIEKTQHAAPGKVCYLQPYAARRIKLLAKSDPTLERPITLYLSLTGSLPYVSYRAKIVGWHDKRDLAQDQVALALLNQHIKLFQPSENDIYLTVLDGKPCVNLISVIDVKRLETQIPVSCFIKTTDGKPLKKHTRAGGWSPVREQFGWLGMVTEAVTDDIEASLQGEVAKSLNDSAAARQQRLAIAPKLPAYIQVVSRAFRRNPDVIAEVLIRANGSCEECHFSAPFRRATDDTPYLEVHHRKLLRQEARILCLTPLPYARTVIGGFTLARVDLQVEPDRGTEPNGVDASTWLVFCPLRRSVCGLNRPENVDLQGIATPPSG